MKPTPEDFQTRFWAKVNKTDSCWVWIGNRDSSGYGKLAFRGVCDRAHRVSYEMLVGPIPEGLVIDHLCRNTSCVNPGHLEPVTPSENTRRTLRNVLLASKTHCVNGHQFTPANTKIRANGTRKCRACDRDHAARAYAKRKGLVA